MYVAYVLMQVHMSVFFMPYMSVFT